MRKGGAGFGARRQPRRGRSGGRCAERPIQSRRASAGISSAREAPDERRNSGGKGGLLDARVRMQAALGVAPRSAINLHAPCDKFQNG